LRKGGQCPSFVQKTTKQHVVFKLPSWKIALENCRISVLLLDLAVANRRWKDLKPQVRSEGGGTSVHQLGTEFL